MKWLRKTFNGAIQEWMEHEVYILAWHRDGKVTTIDVKGGEVGTYLQEHVRGVVDNSKAIPQA